ncbi:MAG: alpha/beta hydrolase [Deltaproteobacteria bacterium]
MIKHNYGKAKVNGIDIYYEIHGTGEPLLLVEGLGYSAWMWYKQIPELSERYQLIVFDNRGAGNTDKPDSEYTIEIMADDAAGLLRTLGVESAHVLGISLGGFIAQELALRHPDLVKSLVLVSTNSGSRRNTITKYSQLWNGYLKLWGFLPGIMETSGKASIPGKIEPYYGLPKEEKIRYGLMSAFTPEYYRNNPDEIDRIVEWRLSNPQPTYAWKRQFRAGVQFDSSERASLIKQPTLVINGSEDKIVTPESAKALSDTIPASRFVLFEESGHLLFIEQSDKFNSTVLGFLDEVSEKSPDDESEWWKKIKSFFKDKKRDGDRTKLN